MGPGGEGSRTYPVHGPQCLLRVPPGCNIPGVGLLSHPGQGFLERTINILNSNKAEFSCAVTMDPFDTPPLCPSSLPSADSYVQLSKPVVLQLIDNIPFEEVSVPKSLVNDDPESIVDFFTEFGLALVDALIKNSPKTASPRKVLHHQFPLQSVLADPETPTKASKENIMSGILYSKKQTKVAAESQDAPKFQLSYAQKHQKRVDAPKQVKQGMSIILDRAGLIPTELMKPEARSLPFDPTAIAEEHSGPSIRETLDPERLEKRMQALQQVDLAKDPYHVARLERADHRYPLPRVAIEGPRRFDGRAWE